MSVAPPLPEREGTHRDPVVTASLVKHTGRGHRGTPRLAAFPPSLKRLVGRIVLLPVSKVDAAESGICIDFIDFVHTTLTDHQFLFIIKQPPAQRIMQTEARFILSRRDRSINVLFFDPSTK